MAKRETYRRKDGRFASRLQLWQGPPKPRHVIEAEFVAAYAAPSRLLEFLRQKNGKPKPVA